MKRFLVASVFKTPDGTVLHSKNRHDFVIHEDKNGQTYGIDGGVDYQRLIGDYKNMTDLSVYSDSNFEKIREFLVRGSRGENFDQPLRYVALKDMGDEHLEAVIDYEETHRPTNKYLVFYKQEKEFRSK